MDVAVCNGHVEVVKLLIREGADASAMTAGGWTYLMQATIAAQESVIPVLVQAGCPLEVTRPSAREFSNDAEGQNALMIAAAWDPRPTRALLHAGANVNARDASGATPLMHALKGAEQATRYGQTSPGKWDVSIIAQLLAAGADPNARDAMGRTPLELAQNLGVNTPQIRSMLVAAGAK